MAPKRESLIERQIIGYLKENPEAQDTLRGIVDKWIVSQRIMEYTEKVRAALVSLERKGRITSRQGPDGQIHYRLKRSPRVSQPKKKS